MHIRHVPTAVPRTQVRCSCSTPWASFKIHSSSRQQHVVLWDYNFCLLFTRATLERRTERNPAHGTRSHDKRHNHVNKYSTTKRKQCITLNGMPRGAPRGQCQTRQSAQTTSPRRSAAESDLEPVRLQPGTCEGKACLARGRSNTEAENRRVAAPLRLASLSVTSGRHGSTSIAIASRLVRKTALP